MLFSHLIFLTIFMPFTLCIYFFANKNFRSIILLLISLIFYSWGEPKALFIILPIIGIGYLGGLVLQQLQKDNDNLKNIKMSKCLLGLLIAAILSALLYFKYWYFMCDNFKKVFQVDFYVNPEIILPVGISFYSFQVISYVIDVYRRELPAEKNLIAFALYVALFPQLIAGPIVRYSTIRNNLQNRNFHFNNVVYGLQRFSIGLAKKIFIADTMSVFADSVWACNANELPTMISWLGIIAYTLQIYYDFSGYSDMAIGLGRVFNFHFLENFAHPYEAVSIQEFWRKWHISLSSWFKDYLYIPLGGNRKGKIRTMMNLFTVFILCGLWHGAAVNFVVWGILHGLGLIFERIIGQQRIQKIPRFLRHCYVLLFIMVGWVFFRSTTLHYALDYIKVMFSGSGVGIEHFSKLPFVTSISNVAMLVIGIAFSTSFFERHVWNKIKTNSWGSGVCIILFTISLIFAFATQHKPFIYFRF